MKYRQMTSATNENKNYFFLFVNWVGVVFFILTLMFFFTDLDAGTNFARSIYPLIRDYLFVNALHVPVSIFLLVAIPNFKIWLNETPSFFKKFEYEILVGFIFFFIMSYFGDYISHKYNRRPHIPNIHIYFNYHVLFSILSSFHTNGQIYGIASILNSESPTENIRPRHFKIERLLFKILPITFALRLFEFFASSIDSETIASYKYLFGLNYAVLCLCCTAVFINAFFISRQDNRNKVFFLTRLLIIPFVGIVQFAGFAYAANHGLENLMVQLNVASKHDNKKKLYLGIVLIMGVWGLLVLPRYFIFNWHLNVQVLAIFMALINAIDLLHYWLERLIYRMRNPLTKKLIAPLIKL